MTPLEAMAQALEVIFAPREAPMTYSTEWHPTTEGRGWDLVDDRGRVLLHDVTRAELDAEIRRRYPDPILRGDRP